MLNLPKQIPVELLLYKTTICLTQPPTTFFLLPSGKKLSKTTAKLYLAKECKKNKNKKKTSGKMHKNKLLSDYNYFIANS